MSPERQDAPAIRIEAVTKRFGRFTALDDVTLDVPGGELVALLGPSGSGKTTLLRVIAGLEAPDGGRILFGGEDATPRHVRDRQVGFVFQHYALFRHMTVFDNIAFGLQVRPRSTRPSKEAIRAKVHELLLQADVFINVPVLKHHSSSDLTIGMKNLMGVVWDRQYWHRTDLMQCIADMAAYRKPDLTVVDAYRVVKRYGPRGLDEEDVQLMEAQLVSTDPVAADAAAAKLFGAGPKDASYIAKAAEAGVGRMDLDKLQIRRVRL